MEICGVLLITKNEGCYWLSLNGVKNARYHASSKNSEGESPLLFIQLSLEFNIILHTNTELNKVWSPRLAENLICISNATDGI